MAACWPIRLARVCPPWLWIAGLVLLGVLLICVGAALGLLWLALLGCVPLIVAPWGLAVPAFRRLADVAGPAHRD